MIKPLPHWIMPGNRNAFDDFESATNQELIARVYKKMQELVNDYNAFVDEINKEVSTLIDEGDTNVEEFKCKIESIVNKYIESLDFKVDMAIANIKENMTIQIKQMVDEGVLDPSILNAFNGLDERVTSLESQVKVIYDETTESLNILNV